MAHNPSFDQVRQMLRTAQRRHTRTPLWGRGARVPYYRRGELVVPGFYLPAGATDPVGQSRNSTIKMMQAAAALPADLFFYDLSAVPEDDPRYATLARRYVIDALQNFDYGDRVRGVRPHAFRSDHFEDDLIEVVGAVGDRLDLIVLGGIESADEVRDIQQVLRNLQRVAGRSNRITFEVIIQSPRAYLQAEAIAGVETVSSLALGVWGLSRSVGGQLHPESWTEDLCALRQTLPLIAAAHGKDAVDGASARSPVRPKSADDTHAMEKYRQDLELTHREAENARRLGFAAKWILHPDQIEPAQSAWTPSREMALSTLNMTVELARKANSSFGATAVDKTGIMTDWWNVRAALQAGKLTLDDISKTGYTLQQLERFVRTDD